MYNIITKAWSKLQITFTNHSHTCMLSFLSTLIKITQKKNIIANYVQNLKVIIDDLALISFLQSDKKIIIHTLDGLGDKYKELIAIIQIHDSLMSFKKLYDKLIDHEIYLKREEKKTGLTITTQFNKKSKRKYNQSNKNFNEGPNKMPLGHMGNT